MTATAKPDLTLANADAEALGDGHVWGEMGILQQMEPPLKAAAAKAKATGQTVYLTIAVAPK